MLQAGNAKNYAIELLRLMYGFRYAWSPQRKNAIISSWLVNTSGVEDKWIPADLYQEHNNLLTKSIHSAKGSNMSWNTLSGSISANVRLFSKIASKLESQYDTPFNKKVKTAFKGVESSLEESSDGAPPSVSIHARPAIFESRASILTTGSQEERQLGTHPTMFVRLIRLDELYPAELDEEMKYPWVLG
ncbi:hypothetical protein B0O80DRAFT_493615 [Mortierella sp. GBAus27b]|nr:hypothetical protein B0O80DRAFT_493615 [Mortierella sp. GBAus27b]